MSKKIFMSTVLYFLIIVGNVKADISVTLEIHNVTENGGIVYMGIYSNEISYKNKTPERIVQIQPSNNIISIDLMLSDGEYLINAYQDVNGNGELDIGLFFIPKEPVGIMNWNGKGIPGNFNKLKILVNNMTARINIDLYKL